MRIGLFGGSFDPIHRGHLEPVERVREALGLDRVIYLPTALPPHKEGKRFAPAHARFAMVELALLDRPGCYASPFELTPGTPAFTVDSVAHFRELHPGAELFLILGADSLLSFHTWKSWREIAELARLAVMVRPGWSLNGQLSDLPGELRELVERERIRWVENPPLAISSSQLRSSLARGAESAADALPDLVLRYINKYALYR